MPMSFQREQIIEEREFPTTERSRSNRESTNAAYRIENLQRYSELCERRILELQPNHPLPVLEEHLGTGNPFIDELQQNPQAFKYSQTGSVLSMSPRSQSLGYNQMLNANNTQSQFSDNNISPNSARALRDHFNAVSNKNQLVEKALREETIANEE